jgi:aspartate ammonia-lyase
VNAKALASKISFLPRSAGVRNSGRSRIEKDSLGASEIPADVYWGIHTLRSLQNFPLTGIQISLYPVLVTALAQIRHAAVQANFDFGLIDEAKKDAMVQACREIEQGELLDQFVVDVIQGGAGTSTHMNVNEVIANRALELSSTASPCGTPFLAVPCPWEETIGACPPMDRYYG